MEAVLKANRPELKDSSIKNYTSNLKSLYRTVFNSDKYQLDGFNDTAPILDHVRQRPVTSQMALLSYLVVLTENPVYQKEMKRVKEIRDAQVEAREPPDEEHTTSPEEIKKIFNRLKKRSAEIYRSGQYSKEALLDLQNTILVALMGNLYIPPRRSMDYVEMLLYTKSDNKNYIDGNELVFNVYKTAATYGQQRVQMPPPLQKLIFDYRQVSPYEYLLTGLHGKPLHSITPRLTELFGHPVGVNTMRRNSTQQFASFADQQAAVKAHMKGMGSSVAVLNHYCR
jgi:hypothetical protein